MNNVESFTWKNCGGQGAGLADLSLTPDPLQFPGTIHISAKAYINTTVQAPLPVSVVLSSNGQSLIFSAWKEVSDNDQDKQGPWL